MNYYIYKMEIRELYNYTPHDVNLVNKHGEILKIIKSSGTARCNMIRKGVSSVSYQGIQINKTMYNTVEGLPPEHKGIYYIVSKPVAEFTKGMRDDLLITDEVYRRNSRVIGCKSLAKMI